MNMKKIANAIAALCIQFCSTAHAATFSSVPTTFEIWSLYVNPQELDNGFDTVIFDAVPTVGFQFANVNSGNLSGEPRPAGHRFTYRNRMLDADPAEYWGPGLDHGRHHQHGGPDRLHRRAARQQDRYDHEPAGLILANFVMVQGNRGRATVQLVNAGTIVFQASIPIIDPEPTSSCLGVSALVALAAMRRRVA